VQLELKIANRTCHYNGMQYAVLADGTNGRAYVQCCVCHSVCRRLCHRSSSGYKMYCV